MLDATGIQEAAEDRRPGPGPTRLSASPNPVRNRAKVFYDLTAPGVVSAAVYDAAGRLTVDLGTSVQSVGRHQLLWNSSTVGAGTYLLRLSTACGTSQIPLVKVH